jgi:hypothetical protein
MKSDSVNKAVSDAARALAKLSNAAQRGTPTSKRRSVANALKSAEIRKKKIQPFKNK